MNSSLAKKNLLLVALLMATARARADVVLTQTFTSGGTILDGNPTGLAAAGSFTQTPGGTPVTSVVSISLGLNVTGGYNGSLYAFLVAPNGNMVTVMNQPGYAMDGFGLASSGMNITLQHSAGVNIQTLTGSYGTVLSGVYQPENPIGTMGLAPANVDGNWQLFIASVMSGGGDATLNSWTVTIDLSSPTTAAPEPGNGGAGLAMGLLLCAGGFRWASVRRGQAA